MGQILCEWPLLSVLCLMRWAAFGRLLPVTVLGLWIWHRFASLRRSSFRPLSVTSNATVRSALLRIKRSGKASEGGQKCDFPRSKEPHCRLPPGRASRCSLVEDYDRRSRIMASVMPFAFVSNVFRAAIALTATSHSLQATQSLLQWPQQEHAGCAVAG